ncbi:MAG: TerB family tellurite resistance protein [Hyphomicrobiaceae bacterium]|nr:TerB family tellurite resistance protein [Hyphomicrobiaceae bacterium]
MSIVLGLIAAIAAVAGALWRLSAAADAARNVVDTANDARGLARRWWWQRKFANCPLDMIDDARTAAVAMMVATAQNDGAITERERTAILDTCVDTFGASREQAEQMLAHARWLTRDVRDLNRCFRKLQPLLRKQCGRDELRDVVRMIRDVGSADGGQPDSIVHDAIARLNRDLTSA